MLLSTPQGDYGCVKVFAVYDITPLFNFRRITGLYTASQISFSNDNGARQPGAPHPLRFFLS